MQRRQKNCASRSSMADALRPRHRETVQGTEESQHLQRPHLPPRAFARSGLRRLRRRAPRLPAAEGNLPRLLPQGRPQRGRQHEDLLREGQEVIVQVDKEERGNKGAALTTFISPGRPLPGADAEQPARRRRLAPHRRRRPRPSCAKPWTSWPIPDDMGVIIRTAGVGRAAEELQWDLDYLLRSWDAIDAAAGPARAVPDLPGKRRRSSARCATTCADDIGEILVDTTRRSRSAQNS